MGMGHSITENGNQVVSTLFARSSRVTRLSNPPKAKGCSYWLKIPQSPRFNGIH